jgi:hypothetical protein
VFSVANGFLDIPEGLAVLDDAPSVLLPSSKWLSDKKNQCVMAGHANDAFAGWTADSAGHIGEWMQAYEICVRNIPVVKRGGAAKRGRSGSWWVGGGEERSIKRCRSMYAALSNDTQLQVNDGLRVFKMKTTAHRKKKPQGDLSYSLAEVIFLAFSPSPQAPQRILG